MHFSIARAVRVVLFATLIGSTAFAADDLAAVFARMDQAAPKFKGMPAELAAQFPKFELWISDATGISIQQKVYEQGGNYSIATYSNMKLDPSIPDSAVKLNLPKGVTRIPL